MEERGEVDPPEEENVRQQLEDVSIYEGELLLPRRGSLMVAFRFGGADARARPRLTGRGFGRESLATQNIHRSIRGSFR